METLAFQSRGIQNAVVPLAEVHWAGVAAPFRLESGAWPLRSTVQFSVQGWRPRRPGSAAHPACWTGFSACLRRFPCHWRPRRRPCGISSFTPRWGWMTRLSRSMLLLRRPRDSPVRRPEYSTGEHRPGSTGSKLSGIGQKAKIPGSWVAFQTGALVNCQKQIIYFL